MRRSFWVLKYMIAGAAMSATTAVTAAPVETSSVDQGWYSSIGVNYPTNPNIVLGGIYPWTHNFLAFDFSGIGISAVTSATLTIFGENGVYSNSHARTTETFSIFDYSGDITSLLAGTAGTAAYFDLGNGSAYGATTINTPGITGPMPEVMITLTALALADINSALAASDKRFVIGGKSPSIAAVEDTNYLWSTSGSTVPAAKLTLYSTTVSPVPLPASLPLFGSGLAALGLFGYRRKRVRRIQR